MAGTLSEKLKDMPPEYIGKAYAENPIETAVSIQVDDFFEALKSSDTDGLWAWFILTGLLVFFAFWLGWKARGWIAPQEKPISVNRGESGASNPQFRQPDEQVQV